YYAYIGSAMNNLEKRVKRHFSKEKVLRWHIDYLVDDPSFIPMTAIYKTTENKGEEHSLASLVNGTPIPSFGCSDCSCPSHLFFMGKSLEKTRIGLESAFIELGGSYGFIERICCVIFDLDNTLVNYDEARDLALISLGKKYLNDPEKFLNIYNSLKKERYRRYPESPERYRKEPIFAEAIRKLVIPLESSLLEGEYWRLVLSNLKPINGAKEIIKWIKASGGRIYVFSDGIRRWQEAKLSSVSLLEDIDDRVYSEDLGLNKVNPSSYEAMLSIIRVKKEESIYVGDWFDVDVKVPLSIGLRSILFSRKEEHKSLKLIGVPIINSLFDLKRILVFSP
ncbi:MAG TPA: DUF123 domain-containing protein, partial [Candidatus Korarchaeota archaeon]|nr:DUF123 domain-containing protein [Candidatus Korarchaeota archaeon]